MCVWNDTVRWKWMWILRWHRWERLFRCRDPCTESNRFGGETLAKVRDEKEHDATTQFSDPPWRLPESLAHSCLWVFTQGVNLFTTIEVLPAFLLSAHENKWIRSLPRQAVGPGRARRCRSIVIVLDSAIKPNSKSLASLYPLGTILQDAFVRIVRL